VTSATLERAVSGEPFSRAEMRGIVRDVMTGALADVQTAGLLAALRTRGETLDEVIGAAEAMRELARPLPEAPPGTIDTCGTGGDFANTFNISTVSALVVAGAGVPVAKHGNRAASSRCGSAELLEALGVAIEIEPERMARAVREVGIGFLYARLCHPAMARVAPVRAALGIRTLFNRLGPLTNPMRVRRQLVGVASASLVEPTLAALVELGAECAWVVHGEDGLDELSVSAPTRVASYANGRTERFIVGHGEIVPAAPRAEIAGGDAAENARIARALLAGEKSARRDAVLLNAGAAFCVAGRTRDLHEGARLAADSLDSGRARDVLERLAAFTKSGGAA
jgi:anthranilate phosphoribosyltransferase